MRKTRTLLSLLLIAALSLSACGGSAEPEPTGEFQKAMHQSDYYRLHELCETEDGYCFLYGGDEAYYIDKETQQIALLCAKPECTHSDESCNARINGGALWSSGDRLYYTNDTLLEEHGELVDHGERVYSAALDGSDRRVVQELEFEPSGNSVSANPILHRGFVYFVYCGVLYRVPLGGDLKKDAEAIWGEPIEKETGNFQVYDEIPVGHTFTLWADGDFVYFMVNVQQADGTYRDTLFAYRIGKEVKQVWQTPDADEVGPWTSTGVSVSKWYVTDGFIYFYLSGGDYWRSDLESGKTEKLADTHEKTQYGKAIFSDEYLCLLNSVPEDMSLPGFELVSSTSNLNYNSLVGGDTFYLYRLDGSFVKELPLTSLYEKTDGIVNVEPIFCADGVIWFVAESEHATGEQGTPQNGFLPAGGVKTYDYTLCRVDLSTGAITQAINWHRE